MVLGALVPLTELLVLSLFPQDTTHRLGPHTYEHTQVYTHSPFGGAVQMVDSKAAFWHDLALWHHLLQH